MFKDLVDRLADSREVPPALCGVRVLLVGDDASALAAFKRQLTAMAAEVFTVSNGDDAMAQCYAVEPHAVMLDLSVGEMSGLELARRLRAIADGRPLWLLALADPSLRLNLAEARTYGIDEICVVPAASRERRGKAAGRLRSAG